MASVRQYYKGVYYYTRATLIYRELRRYLKNEFEGDLRFSTHIKKEYFYHSPLYNRTKQYMHANHFFGELLCLLRNKTIQAEERMRFANLSSCAPIFDDFFEKGFNLIHIHELLKQPLIENAQSDEEKLAVHFLQNILQSLEDDQDFLIAAERLFQAQEESKTQIDNSLSLEELQGISLRKGGYSGLMYAHLLQDSNDEVFFQIAYYLGSYGQLMDDVFDIYDDAVSGVRTFANQSETVKDIEDVIEKQTNKILEQIEVAAIENYETYHFKNVFSVFSSIIHMALLQYKSIEETYHISPKQCLKLPRKTWVIDMEKPANIWRLFHTSVQKL